MGNNNSSVAGASFDSDEIRRLEKRFRKLDTNGSGSLTPDGLSFRGDLRCIGKTAISQRQREYPLY